SFSSRASGTDTSPTFGSMVQNGKFAACAAAVRVSALKRVDLPTFGSPTMPILKPMRPSIGDPGPSTGRLGRDQATPIQPKAKDGGNCFRVFISPNDLRHGAARPHRQA